MTLPADNFSPPASTLSFESSSTSLLSEISSLKAVNCPSSEALISMFSDSPTVSSIVESETALTAPNEIIANKKILTIINLLNFKIKPHNNFIMNIQ